MSESEAVIHVVDDDRAAREGLQFMLGSLGLEVVPHGSAADLLAKLDDTRRGCILADVRMPAMSGLELLDELKARDCPLPVIMITGHGDVPMAVRAIQAGALDFFEKPVNGLALVERIRAALTLCEDQLVEALGRNALARQIETLTRREVEVAHGVLAGRQNKQIAADLGISLKTVEIHRHNLMGKMNAHSAADLVRKLIAAGWEA
ncbi:response regulator transcription factor [Thioclava sp. F28-4]|uniref:response regulator transcription factor n=1 Tax=Thioclava sp. F28-4 TaxID=1915315 RepID=UPI00099747A2|nr:response regulator [Thioclava sp. F28-4]OOY02878.1 hypothetical protein BMI87_20455 [Thioclava sp. F28-4]